MEYSFLVTLVNRKNKYYNSNFVQIHTLAATLLVSRAIIIKNKVLKFISVFFSKEYCSILIFEYILNNLI
jgi:hypothetical protein